MKTEKKAALNEFHRRTIQRAAEELFLEKGVDATSIDEIAMHAGYSKATLYVYFKSKSDIWNGVLLSAMRALRDRVEATTQTEQGGFSEQYLALCKAIQDFSQDNPLYFESLLGMIPIEGNETSQQIFVTGEEVTNLVGQMIARGVEEGAVRADVKFPEITMVFWACISGWIRMVNQKETYLSGVFGSNKESLLLYGFTTILQSVIASPANK